MPDEQAKEYREREAKEYREREDEREKDERDEEQRPEVKPEPQGVWLLIRYDTADTGVRPVPSGECFWLSPDIWISGGDGLGNAIAGEPTGVHARVWNFGNFGSTPTRVDFAFADPMLGIPFNAPQLIGTAWPSIPPLSEVVVDCPVPWEPPDYGTSHSCLLVLCRNDPLDNAPQTSNPVQDRRVGQRNVTIVQAEAGGHMDLKLMMAPVIGERLPLQLFATAAFVQPRDTLAIASAEGLMRTLRALDRELVTPRAKLLVRRAILAARELSGPAERHISGKELARLVEIKQGPEGRPAHVRPRLPRGLHAPLRLAEPFEIRNRVAVEVSLGLTLPELDSDLLIHIWQLEGNQATGGYSVLVKA